MSNKENREMNDNASKESSENSLVENPKVKIEWSPENELIMIEWCDVAQCYKWLNSRAHSKYSYMHAWFTIPAIIFQITNTNTGMEMYNKTEFIDKLSTPLKSLGDIEIIETIYKDDEIISLRFIQK